MKYHVLNTLIRLFCAFSFSFISFTQIIFILWGIFTQTKNENTILPNWLNFDRVKYPNVPKIICCSWKVYSYQKADFETMRKDALRFTNEKYFSGHSYARSVQENFNFINSWFSWQADPLK